MATITITYNGSVIYSSSSGKSVELLTEDCTMSGNIHIDISN